MMDDKFRVDVGHPWHWTDTATASGYFEKFWFHCIRIARANGWDPMTVANHHLRPLQGKLIATSTQGWYLRWDNEASHTAFVLRWA